MCSRFAVWMQVEDEIAVRYSYIQPGIYQPPSSSGEEESQLLSGPRYNIAPQSAVSIIRRITVDNHSMNVIQRMKWGVIPRWLKQDSNSRVTINARAETLIDGQSRLWNSLRGKRCIVPVNGYFKWITKGKSKIPYYIRYKDDRPVLLAGLWDLTLLEGNTYPTYSFVIITTPSSEQLSSLTSACPRSSTHGTRSNFGSVPVSYGTRISRSYSTPSGIKWKFIQSHSKLGKSAPTAQHSSEILQRGRMASKRRSKDNEGPTTRSRQR